MKTLISFMLVGCAIVLQAQTGPQPNIIIILADDLGYADVGIHGCRDIPTPNIDALAARGVRFTSGYSSHPFCSPMRAGLMAGRYQQRFGYVSNVAFDPQNPKIGLPSGEKTIAKRLKEAGYVTGMAGKWHLGANHVFHPNRRGFDYFFGFLGGGHDYFEVDMRTPMAEGYKQPLERNGTPQDLTGYLTDVLTEEAVTFISRNFADPFFFYLAYNAPHTPLQAPETEITKFAHIPDKRRRTYAAMVHIMDRGIGQVIQALDDHQIRENTLVFFLSDNGGPTHANASRNDPLRGDKGDVYEGGIRVPFIASWPGVIPEGRTYDHPVISLDISMTALSVGKAQIGPRLEGENLIPYLTGRKKGEPHDSLVWEKDGGTEWAVRSGSTKLLQTKIRTKPDLFQLDRDIAETSNQATNLTEVVTRFTRKYEAWKLRSIPPTFPSYRQYHERKKVFYEEMTYEGGPSKGTDK